MEQLQGSILLIRQLSQRKEVTLIHLLQRLPGGRRQVVLLLLGQEESFWFLGGH
jgi:hypothetical protein